MSASYLQPSQITNEHMVIALHQVKLGFWEWDLATNELKCTLQNKLNFGYSEKDSFTLESVIAAILPEDRMRRTEALEKAMDKNFGVYSFDCRVRHADQRIHWLQISGTTIFDDDVPRRIIGTSLDITEKKDLEILRDEVLNIANHELKTPLSAVKGYLQLLHRFVARTGNEHYEQIAFRALNATDKITRLLNDALQPDAVQANEMVLRKEEVDMRTLVEEVIANTMLVNQSHRIDLTVDGNLTKIEGDRYRLGQALTNVMNNAVKYSPDHDQIDVALKATNDDIKVTVRDYGIGIPDGERDKIFSKFYRIKNGYDSITGSGIGLFITSEIIARHGGKIEFEQAGSGTGTIFNVTLPRR
ncbi:PAS domain-containing sensor histidine kinase [Mucilaginibacter daejeonensis]|uniref:PAS domain-containing sensor histidine kinase n=1 Tax=Mucilaginibacter daejeonensis TaxID=398049 RepID=UPI001D17CC9C|nr:PAS domain-containing sensor histidine kinase [Mucilaginibacter daejeonensis]UEG51929.1 PAS domain-containing sensor histidine kinase [Mucilaginibacter daejeonensis]